jgi:hypothetical protein
MFQKLTTVGYRSNINRDWGLVEVCRRKGEFDTIRCGDGRSNHHWSRTTVFLECANALQR